MTNHTESSAMAEIRSEDMQGLGNYVNGKHSASRSDRLYTVCNPASGEPRVEIGLSTAAETRDAIAVAAEAFESWRLVPPLRRARVLFAFNSLLEKHRDELAELITFEHGKVPSDAAGEVTRGREVVEFACGIPHLLKGRFPPLAHISWVKKYNFTFF